MDKLIISFIFFFLWVILPALLLTVLNIQRKKKYVFSGTLYVRKKHRNSGPNPCDHAIDIIVPIDIAEVGDNLYTSK